MRRRTTCTVLITRRGEDGTDRRGNPIITWSDPEPVPVYAVAPGSSDEPTETGRHDAMVKEWTIYAPPGTQVTPADRIELPNGIRTEVLGEIAEWGDNPHHRITTQHGVVIRVQRRKG